MSFGFAALPSVGYPAFLGFGSLQRGLVNTVTMFGLALSAVPKNPPMVEAQTASEHSWLLSMRSLCALATLAVLASVGSAVVYHGVDLRRAVVCTYLSIFGYVGALAVPRLLLSVEAQRQRESIASLFALVVMASGIVYLLPTSYAGWIAIFVAAMGVLLCAHRFRTQITQQTSTSTLLLVAWLTWLPVTLATLGRYFWVTKT